MRTIARNCKGAHRDVRPIAFCVGTVAETGCAVAVGNAASCFRRIRIFPALAMRFYPARGQRNNAGAQPWIKTGAALVVIAAACISEARDTAKRRTPHPDLRAIRAFANHRDAAPRFAVETYAVIGIVEARHIAAVCFFGVRDTAQCNVPPPNARAIRIFADHRAAASPFAVEMHTTGMGIVEISRSAVYLSGRCDTTQRNAPRPNARAIRIFANHRDAAPFAVETYADSTGIVEARHIAAVCFLGVRDTAQCNVPPPNARAIRIFADHRAAARLTDEVHAMNRGQRTLWIALGVGMLALLISAVLGLAEPRQALLAYLFALLFFTGLSTGALALLMIHQLTGGAWGYDLRPGLLAAARVLPLLALLALPLLFGVNALYPGRPRDTTR